MTVYIEKPAVNLREELADLRNQGTYQEQQFYFDSLVTNGDGSSTAGWTFIAPVTFTSTSGQFIITRGEGAITSFPKQTILTAGRAYFISFDVIALSHSVSVYAGADLTRQLTVTATGTHSGVLVASGADLFIGPTASSTATCTVDNIYVFETDGTDVVHRMPKGWVPKDVFEDGLLQREGAANDYTVVYDGFDYYVKPAVAPSATTQTCVIGVKA